MTAPDTAPLVSVVIPVFNAGETLAATVASVQAQSLMDWEALLVDDGSRDDSAAIMARLAASDPRIRCLSTEGQQGAGPARNAGIAAARGRFIAFLDADDQWHPEKLKLQLAAMAETGIPFSCTAYLRVNAAKDNRRVVGVPARARRADLLKTNTVACSTAIYDRAHFGPRAMPDLRRRQDFALWLDLLRDTPVVLGLPLVLMTYREDAGSLSAPKGRAAADTWRMYRQIPGLGLPQAAWYFGHYALRGLLRHRLPGLARRLGWLQGAGLPAAAEAPNLATNPAPGASSGR
ncbi:glycosyltransferase family 2 protein [Gemmobacter serpentinus]|uniref:glycosyltransferase family 2 protein n=1 Tax=Gemmobacter serpentinus TaxID=2652247 RepID=UPI00124C2099|nr:glycosyltransferase family 2 protein [Gemmobacter serpentinus]